MGKSRERLIGLVALIVLGAIIPVQSRVLAKEAARVSPPAYVADSGTISFDLDAGTLESLGWSITTNGDFGLATDVTATSAPIQPSPALEFVVDRDGVPTVTRGWLQTRGAWLITGAGTRTAVGDLTIGVDGGGLWTVNSTLGAPDEDITVFDLSNVMVDFSASKGSLRVVGTLSVDESWAFEIGRQDAADVEVGVLVIDAKVNPAPDESSRPAGEVPLTAAGTGGAESRGVIGPDVIVADLYQTKSYGSLGFEDISAFAIGTDACNVGDEPLVWYANTNQHPVISQSLYRWKNQGFEQIGISWVKHGFFAVAGTLCGPCENPTGGNNLGVGCSDPYSASLNGNQDNMSPRSQVNPHTGEFQYPWTAPDPAPVIGRRLQVRNDNLDPSLNPTAVYFIEGHYVTPDDAAAGNQNNNASYRRATIDFAGGMYLIDVSGITVRRQPAIRAWRDNDPAVVETDIQDPNDGLYILSAKAIYGGSGFWHYDYALFNLNADRGARSFSVPVDPGATIANVGFHDVEHHSGEPYSGTDWSWQYANNEIKWWTDTYQTDPNANALRWGTLYNFRFDANVEPATVFASIGLFAPGTPGSLKGTTIGPRIMGVCGDGLLEGLEECDPPDGTTCHTDCTLINGDALRGGLIWDKWWIEAGSEPPTGNHPLYPASGQQSGSNTYRCKECHGWDYKGVNGAYGTGPHFTGIPGVFGSTLNYSEMFDLIKSGTVPNGHGFESFGLTDTDIWDVVHFMKEMLIDTGNYIDAGGAFLGDDVQGGINYTSAGSTACVTCHGADGTAINFGTPQDPHWVGTAAVEHPEELLHKIRFGAPGSAMPSWTAEGGSDQGAADIGAYAQLNFPSSCITDEHCNDGLYCNGVESCNAGLCVAGLDPCPEQPCDELTQSCGVADALRGGLLWDKWWDVLTLPPPPGEHPLYPPVGQQTGSATYRCKECHGWDYKGAGGAYGSGSHFTGIPGVFGSTMTPVQMFDLISGETVPNGHGFASYGLGEQEIWDLIQFIQDLTVDTDLYIDGAGQFIGDAAAGEISYTSGGTLACIACHGTDGTAINFGTAQQPEWVGTIAVQNPWELLHKIRVGQPASPMTSWLAAGETDQGAADIGLYAQLNFPVECTTDSHCNDGLYCNGQETCVNRFCDPGVDPCPGGVCDESIATCLSGLCDTPLVEAVGGRYLAITPQPAGSPVPQAFLVTPSCPGGAAKYVGSLRCGGTGRQCRTQADCNECSFGKTPCLSDAECDYGVCTNGQECSVSAQNCLDLTPCVGIEVCNISGQSCIPGDLAPIDTNNDGLFDGVVGVLVDDPANAAFLTPDEWGTSVTRCGRTGLPCVNDSDCDKGICGNGVFCSVAEQNCLDSSVCVLNETCVSGRAYITGDGITPTDWINGTPAPMTYEVRANCGTVLNPDQSFAASATMWRWGDTDNNGFVNVSDIQLIMLAVQGSYEFSSLVSDDLAGQVICEPQQVLNVTDILMAIRAVQGETYSDTGCPVVCP